MTIPGGLGGIDTLVKLKELDPDVVAIVSSGSTNDPIVVKYKKYGFRGALMKSFKPAQLLDCIRDSLDQA